MSKCIVEISVLYFPLDPASDEFLRENKAFLRLSKNFHVVALLTHFPPLKGQLAQKAAAHDVS